MRSPESTKQTDNQHEVLTVEEVGQILQCGRNMAYAIVKRHGLALRLGRKIVVPRVRLEKFLAGDKAA